MEPGCQARGRRDARPNKNAGEEIAPRRMVRRGWSREIDLRTPEALVRLGHPVMSNGGRLLPVVDDDVLHRLPVSSGARCSHRAGLSIG
jgi:hypothetical protein